MTKWIRPTYPPKRPRFKSWLTSQVEVSWRSPKMFGKNLHGSFVLVPYPPFFFLLPSLAIRKNWFNAPPWTYCVLPTQERATDTSCFSPPHPAPYLNFLRAKQNYLYRENKCHSTKHLCKHCQWSGTPPSLVLSRPTWNL